MLEKFFPILFIVALLFAGLTGCSAAVTTTTSAHTAALGAQETFRGLQAVMRSAPGTFVMERGELLLMAWPRKGEYAFAVLSKTGVGSNLSGLKVNTFSLSEMMKSLETDGWKFITPKAVPAAIADSLKALTVEMALMSMRSLPSVFIVPVTLFDPINPEPIQN
jgi:hypothetical protein